MWQRFTERARRVVFFAQEESRRLGENYVSTEHLLLGLIREHDSAAARVLDRIGVSLGRIRSEVERQVAHAEGRLGQDMQLTPRSKRVIDLAYDEAREMGNNYIGSEHLLLGLIREGEGLAGRVLLGLGVELERVREEVRRLHDETAKQKEKGDDPQQAQSEPKSLDAEPQPQKGDLGVLQNADGRKQVEVAASQEALAELLEVMQLKDHHGYRDMASGDRITILPAATEVKILRVDDPRGYHVRILSGAREGQTGWVARTQLQHTGPDTRPFPPPVPESNQDGGQQEQKKPQRSRNQRNKAQDQ